LAGGGQVAVSTSPQAGSAPQADLAAINTLTQAGSSGSPQVLNRRAFGERLLRLRNSAAATQGSPSKAGHHSAAAATRNRVRAWQRRIVAWATQEDNHLQAGQTEASVQQVQALQRLQDQADSVMHDLREPTAAQLLSPPNAPSGAPTAAAPSLTTQIEQTQRELLQDLQALADALGLLGFMNWAFDPQAPYPAFDIEQLLTPQERADLCTVLTTLIQLEQLASALAAWAQQSWQQQQMQWICNLQVQVFTGISQADRWAEDAAQQTREADKRAQAAALQRLHTNQGVKLDAPLHRLGSVSVNTPVNPGRFD
jgi:hypothetical protein